MAFKPGVGNIATYSEGKLRKKIQLYAEEGDVFNNFGNGLSITGSLEVKGFISGMGFGNAQVITGSAVIPDAYNSILYGPITIGAASSLRIGLNSVVKIKDILNV